MAQPVRILSTYASTLYHLERARLPADMPVAEARAITLAKAVKIGQTAQNERIARAIVAQQEWTQPEAESLFTAPDSETPSTELESRIALD